MATPLPMTSTGNLTPTDRDWILSFLADRPWFDFYFQCALDDLATGLDNRAYHLGGARQGLVIALLLDDVDLVSFVGTLEDAEVAFVAELPHRAELHVEAAHVPGLLSACASRLRRTDDLRYYTVSGPDLGEPDARCRPVTSAEHGAVRALFADHYPETVLTDYMLGLPFVGVWDGADLVAAAGTIVVNERLGACHLGNFLTHPDRRGQGLARVAARGLFRLLAEREVRTFNLGVYEANAAAWRAYEALGFTLVETRPMLYLEPPV